jgi:hypothetical protein
MVAPVLARTKLNCLRASNETCTSDSLAVGHAVGSVIALEVAKERHRGARKVVLLIQDFFESPNRGEHRDAVRGDPYVAGAVIDALKALHWQIQKRRMEQSAQPRRGQASATGGAAARGE